MFNNLTKAFSVIVNTLLLLLSIRIIHGYNIHLVESSYYIFMLLICTISLFGMKKKYLFNNIYILFPSLSGIMFSLLVLVFIYIKLNIALHLCFISQVIILLIYIYLIVKFEWRGENN